MSANTLRQNMRSAELGSVIFHQLAAAQTTGRAWYPIFEPCKISEITAKWHTAASQGTVFVYVHKPGVNGTVNTSGTLLGSILLTQVADTEYSISLTSAGDDVYLEDGDYIAIECDLAMTSLQGAVLAIRLLPMPQ